MAEKSISEKRLCSNLFPKLFLFFGRKNRKTHGGTRKSISEKRLCFPKLFCFLGGKIGKHMVEK